MTPLFAVVHESAVGPTAISVMDASESAFGGEAVVS